MLYEYHCPVCNEFFDEFRTYAERHEVFHCGTRAEKLISEPYTTKDKAYEFETNMFGGKTHITSKVQFKRLLKEHHIPDASPRECIQQAKFRKRVNAESNQARIRTQAEKLASTMQKEGLGLVAKEAVSTIIHNSTKAAKKEGT